MSTKHIGIDIGGTKVKGIIVSDGKISGKVSHQTQDGGDWKQEVKKVYLELSQQITESISSVGLSAPGIAREDNQAIAFLPNRLHGLENFVWSNYLGVEVRILNDAHAALVAEARLGVGKGCENLLLITLGTGVGGGLMIDGSIHQGFLQRAGHLGHVCVDAHGERPSISGITGSLEDAIGEASLSERSLGRFEFTSDLVSAYEAGETWATHIWLSSVRKLALAIVSFCNAISPELVILAGGITKADASLLTPLKSYMDIYEWRPGGIATPIKIAQFEEYAGAIGAALFGS